MVQLTVGGNQDFCLCAEGSLLVVLVDPICSARDESPPATYKACALPFAIALALKLRFILKKLIVLRANLLP